MSHEDTDLVIHWLYEQVRGSIIQLRYKKGDLSIVKKYILSILCIIITASVFVSGCSKKTKQSDENAVAYADKYIDLHLHLDGAITPDIAKKLAAVQNIELPTEDDEKLKKLLTVPEDCTDLKANLILCCMRGEYYDN